MKRIFCIWMAAMCVMGMAAQEKAKAKVAKQVISYETRIYTDKNLARELTMTADQSRGFGMDLLATAANAAIGVATSYISSLVDLGVQAIGQLITMDRRHHQEWMENAKRECIYTDSIGTLYALNDFYAVGSDRGTLDPEGIQFNGIGCLARVGDDTAFYVSCHLNRAKLHRILDHSKFEMVVDSIVINPYRSHLPKTTLPIAFSFADRKSFNFRMTIQILSSWMDFTPSLHQNELLGEFVLNVPIDSAAIEKSPNGTFYYVRTDDESPYELVGESFIVPRSYMQITDSLMGFHDHYGTGQYSVNVFIEERCELTQAYQKNWRHDRKMRKQMVKQARKKMSFDDVCRKVTKQTWDESLQAWVITILKAPTDYSIKALNELMRVPTGQQQQQQQQQQPGGK